MERRFARVSVLDSIIQMIALGRRDVALTSDWPEDAVIVGGDWEHTTGMMTLTIWASRFDEVPLGNVIPNWKPTITAYAMEPPAAALIELIDAFRKGA